MNVLESLHWRYATKRFDPEKIISVDKIAILKEAFNLTATSYGLQPIKLLLIKDKSLQEKLVKHTMNQQQVAQASHVLVFCIQTNINEIYVTEYFDRVHTLRQTPKTILKPYQDFLIKDFSSRTYEDIKDWATKQAYLAMGNLLTVCALEKIDTCPMEGFEPEAYNKILHLTESGLEAVLVMPIGYRAADDKFANFKKVRKTVAESTWEL
ncbi:MAG TPA: NAD(P)H-dependent oxidoreductase [Flavobacteriaceae bacterium]|nr:NAD(P)H-dependent oxidoreductase [Flavobacteriaceae bacterium]